MKLAVIGASRGAGRYVVDEALERGHRVTALVRDPSTIVDRPGLTVVRGDGTSVIDVAKVVEGQDAVVCCLGPTTMKRGAFVVSAAARALVTAMEAHGVRRVLLISTVGVGDSAGLLRLVMPFFELVARGPYDSILGDKTQAEKILQATDLEYTLVRPTRLTDAPPTGIYKTGDGKGMVRFRAISRADLASFIIDELEQPSWIRGAPAVWM